MVVFKTPTIQNLAKVFPCSSPIRRTNTVRLVSIDVNTMPKYTYVFRSMLSLALISDRFPFFFFFFFLIIERRERI